MLSLAQRVTEISTLFAPRVNPARAGEAYRRGLRRLQRGKLRLALDDFRMAAIWDADWADPWFQSGLVRLALGAADEAIADLDRALELHGRHAEARLQRGLARQELGDLDGAAADFDRALKEAQGKFAALVLHHRAVLKRERGIKAEARADFELALEIDPSYPARVLGGELPGAAAARYEERYM